MKIHFVKKARKNNCKNGIKKGDSYYWWKDRLNGKNFSRERPTPKQLTQSNYFRTLWELQDRINDLPKKSSPDTITRDAEHIILEVIQLRERQSKKFLRMPEALRATSNSGFILTDRVNMLDHWIAQLRYINLEIHEDLSEEERVTRFTEICDELSNSIHLNKTTV